MGFSTQQLKRGNRERPWKVHPVWRGIGCIMLLLVPFMSWFTAELVLESNLKDIFPYELTRVAVLPFVHITEVDKIILHVNYYFQNTGFMLGQVFLTVIFSFIGFGIVALLYAIIYRFAGPPRYGPFDIPTDRV